MRKIIAFILGCGMLFGGMYLLYNLFFNAAKIPFMFVAGSGFMMFLGGYLIFDTLKNWNKE